MEYRKHFDWSLHILAIALLCTMLVLTLILAKAYRLVLGLLVGVFIFGAVVLEFLLISYAEHKKKLFLTQEGIILKSILRKREVAWTDVTSFVLTDSYNIILRLAKGRPIMIELAMFREPERLLGDIKQYLGEPKFVERWFSLFSRPSTSFIVASICSVPLAIFTTIIGWAIGFVTGMGGATYILWKESYPAEKSKNKDRGMVLVTMFVAIVSSGLLIDLLNLSMIQKSLFGATFVSGWIVGLDGHRFLVSYLRARSKRQ